MTTSPIRPIRETHNPGTDALPSARNPVPSVKTGLVTIAPGLLGKASRIHALTFWVLGVLGFLAVILVVLHFGSLETGIRLARREIRRS